MQRLQGMTGLNNPVEIQLQYLPDDVLLARACITPASPTEENRNLALPARLQDFSTSPEQALPRVCRDLAASWFAHSRRTEGQRRAGMFARVTGDWMWAGSCDRLHVTSSGGGK